MAPASTLALGLVLAQTLALGPNEPASPPPALPPEADASTHNRAEPEAGRAVPGDGRGSVATGGLVLGLGGAMLGGGIAGAALGAQPEYWAPFMATSVIPLALGGLLVGVGRKRTRRYAGWTATQGEPVPAQGQGLRSPGIVLVALGSGTTVIGGILTLATRVQVGYPGPDGARRGPPAYPLAILATGATALAVGIGLTAVGERRRKAFERWRHAPELTPVLAPMPGGAQLGLAGRF